MTSPIEPLPIDTTVFARRLRASSRPGLCDIDLDILPGEIFAVVGRAGAGKTALLEGLVGLRRLEADQLIVCGSDPRAFPAAVRQRIGVAPRRAAVERKLRVGEALALFATFYERAADTAALLDVLGLLPFRDWAADRLPPDAAQRFSLALALVNDPVVLFADEPTRDLDPEHARRVWDLLRDRRRRGRTVVLTTDHLEEAERVADRVAILEEGRLVAVEAPSALLGRADRKVLVTFDLPRPQLDPELLRRLEGAVEASREGDLYSIWSTDGFATTRALIRMLDGLAARPRVLGMRQPTLDDVFFQLVGGAARA